MGFERCHPAVNLIYFAAVIAGTVTFQHPVFLMLSFLCACAYSIRRNRGRAVIFDLCLIPCAIAFALYYSSYHHFGITVLQQNFVGNNMTLESLVYGLVAGIAIAGVCIWMSCVYSVFSTDKMVYLFGFIIIGYIIAKLKIVPRGSAGVLSKLENNLFIPALVLQTFMQNFTRETLGVTWKLFAFGFIISCSN